MSAHRLPSSLKVKPKSKETPPTLWEGKFGSLTNEQLAQMAKEFALTTLGDLANMWLDSQNRTDNLYIDRGVAAKTKQEQRRIHAEWMRERQKTNREYSDKSTTPILQANDLRITILNRLSPMRRVANEDNKAAGLFKKLLSGKDYGYLDLAAAEAYLFALAGRLPYFHPLNEPGMK